MGKTALSIGATTFAFFTRNPRGSSVKKADPEDAAALRELMAEHGFGKLVAHAPYTINPCAAKPETLDFAHQTMAADLRTLELLPGNYYNFHPGNHVGQGTEVGIAKIIETLNDVMFDGMQTTVLLETMAGKGTEVGGKFEELRAILDGVRDPAHVGVCLDTCHVWDGGYDIANDPDGVFAEFDRVVGLDKLCAIHMNDSKNPLGAHKDRHEVIGGGYLGEAAFARLVCHPVVHDLPIILETPNELPGYAQEIARLREFESRRA
jgi:deoxyribonuclease-4